MERAAAPQVVSRSLAEFRHKVESMAVGARARVGPKPGGAGLRPDSCVTPSLREP